MTATGPPRSRWEPCGASGRALSAGLDNVEEIPRPDSGSALGPCLVVVPIHDAGLATEGCVRALLRRTRAARIVVLDDAAAQPEVVEALRALESRGGLEYVRHDEARGLEETRRHALGLALAGGRALALVPPEVEVGPGWLPGLMRAALCRQEAGPVAAVAVPRGAQQFPAHLGWPDVARAALRADVPLTMPSGTSPAVCLLYPARVIERLIADPAATLPAFLARRVVVRWSEDSGVVGAGPAGDSALADLVDGLAVVPAVRPRVLYVTPEPDLGGAASLARALRYFQDSYLLTLGSAGRPELFRVTAAGPEPLLAWAAESGVRSSAGSFPQEATRLLVHLGIDVIHADFPLQQALSDVVENAARLGVPIVAGLPTLSAVRDGDGDDALSPAAVKAAAFVVVDDRAAELLRSRLSADDGARVRVIQPCFDLGGLSDLRARWARRRGPLRALVPADWTAYPGADLIREIARQAGPAVEWHALGPGSDRASDFAVPHATAERKALMAVLGEIDPDLSVAVALPARESLRVLAESWALGLPVLTTECDAAAPLVRDEGGGIVVPATNPARSAAELLRRVDSTALTALRRRVPRRPPPLPAQTAAQFAEVYRSLEGAEWDGRRRVGYVMHGELGVHGGCKHIRVLGRLASPEAERHVTARQIFLHEILRGDVLAGLDVLLVQRDALFRDTEELLAAIRASGVRVVVELDDDLMDPAAAPRLNMGAAVHRSLQHRLTSVIRSADELIVSTVPLARHLDELTDAPKAVVPNELDPRLWMSALEPGPPPSDGAVRLLYMGTLTHREDMMLLRHVLAPVSEATGLNVVLEVVGVAAASTDDEWIQRLRIPPGAENYPEFVAWLRSHRARWTAAVAPLVDSEFNASKSDLKLLEYSMLGLPVVASDVGPYRGADALAVLTSNDREAWAEALTEVLVDPESAKQRADSARAHVVADRMLSESSVRSWLTTLLGSDVR